MTSAVLARPLALRCTQCGAPHMAQIWEIVDAAAQSELLERVRAGSLHTVICPHCSSYLGRIKAPLLIYRPGAHNPLLFSPIPGNRPDENRLQVADLITRLRTYLGDGWQEAWVATAVPMISRDELPGYLAAQQAGRQGLDLQQLLQAAVAAEDRYWERRDVNALRAAAAAWQAAIEHPDLARINAERLLAIIRFADTILMDCFRTTADQTCLQSDIHLLERAVRGQLATSTELPALLNNLGNRLVDRFLCSGRAADLDQGIAILQEAIDHAPADWSYLPALYTNIGANLFDRYQQRGRNADLDRAITMFQNALRDTPAGPMRPQHLSNVGITLLHRYERLGRIEDIEQSVALLGEAAREFPTNSPEWSSCISNLGAGLVRRYEKLGQVDDLERAIKVLDEGIRRSAADNPLLAALFGNLGTAWLSRYKKHRQPGDLQQAISALEQAVRQTPVASPERAERLKNLQEAQGYMSKKRPGE